MKWIAWRVSCGAGFVKFYGQVEKGDLAKIGKESIKIYNPMVSKAAMKPSEIEGGSPSVVVSTTSVLDLEDSTDNYQVFNTSCFINWQVINVLKLISSLDDVAKEINQRRNDVKGVEKEEGEEEEK